MSAHRAEPTLGLALPARVGSRKDGRNRWRSLSAFSCLFGIGSCASGVLVLTFSVLAFCGRGSVRSSRLTLHNLSSGTEFNHVDCALAASDQVPARKEDYLAWSGQTQETFGRRFILLRDRGDTSRRVSSGNGSRWCSLVGRGAGQAVNLVKMESMGTNLVHSASDKRDRKMVYTHRRLALDDFDNPGTFVLLVRRRRSANPHDVEVGGLFIDAGEGLATLVESRQPNHGLHAKVTLILLLVVSLLLCFSVNDSQGRASDRAFLSCTLAEVERSKPLALAMNIGDVFVSESGNIGVRTSRPSRRLDLLVINTGRRRGRSPSVRQVLVAAEFESCSIFQLQKATEPAVNHSLVDKDLRVCAARGLVCKTVGRRNENMNGDTTFWRITVVLELQSMVMLGVGVFGIIGRRYF